MHAYESVTIPDFPRKYTKVQPAGPRVFMASGPKADMIIRMILSGAYTTKEMCALSGASASRVSECRWALDAAGITYSIPTKASKAASNIPAPTFHKAASLVAGMIAR